MHLSVVKRSSGIANKNRACEKTLKSNALRFLLRNPKLKCYRCKCTFCFTWSFGIVVAVEKSFRPCFAGFSEVEEVVPLEPEIAPPVAAGTWVVAVWAATFFPI